MVSRHAVDDWLAYSSCASFPIAHFRPHNPTQNDQPKALNFSRPACCFPQVLRTHVRWYSLNNTSQYSNNQLNMKETMWMTCLWQRVTQLYSVHVYLSHSLHTWMALCVTVTWAFWQQGPPDRSRHSGQWHSSRAPDASWASGVKNAGRPYPLSCRWMEHSVHSPVDEWSDLSCQRRSTERLQYPAYIQYLCLLTLETS